jgi:hypothetical protein
MGRARVAVWFGIFLTVSTARVATATGPRLVDFRTVGPAVESVYETSSGVSASLGVPVGECLIRGSAMSGTTSLVFTVEPNDGGLISFSYRFQTMRPWLCLQSNPSMWCNTFKAQLRLGAGYAGEPRETLFADRTSNCKLRDTGWVETTIYVPPASQIYPSTDPLELWMSVWVETAGYVAEWQEGGLFPSHVDIRDVIAMCPNTSSSFSMLPAGTDRFRPHSRMKVAANATPVTPTCKGCCIGDLTPVDPGDTDSVTMENHYNAWDWLPKCTQGIRDGTACFKTAMEGANDTFRLENTMRTLWYQRHFYEVWTKSKDLAKDQNPACADLRTKVNAEMSKHLLTRKPATGLSEKAARHVNGEAIDISTRVSNQTQAQRDALADTCSLYRRVADDYVHYEVKP